MSSNVFTFHPLQERHLTLMHEWLRRPHVADWWGPAESVEELRADYVTAADAPNATRAFIVHSGAEPIGFIQCYVAMNSGGGWWVDETDPGVRGIDQFIADATRLGRGLGRGMIRAFLHLVFQDASVTVVQTDPDPENERAVRCYTAAGFVPQGVVTTPDGPALLMRCTRESLFASER